MIIDERSDQNRETLVARAELLARILDGSVRIPGTHVYLGLDPILGLIPGLGDILANAIGLVMVWWAIELKVPRILMARMILNLLINGTVGAIPVLGDCFSLWFRSHARNAALLRQTVSQQQGAALDWFYVAGILVGSFVLLLSLISAILWAVAMLWTAITQ